jgi:hypothetical protein
MTDRQTIDAARARLEFARRELAHETTFGVRTQERLWQAERAVDQAERDLARAERQLTRAMATPDRASP